MWIFKYKPFTHRRIHFRDWSCKDKIIFNHISNYKKKCQHHRCLHMRTGAKKVRARPFSRARGCFHIVTCIVDIMHGKTKYSMTIYLTTTKNSATWGRACAHKSRKHTCAAVFSLARPFSHSKMHFRDLSQTEKILIKNISNCRMRFK